MSKPRDGHFQLKHDRKATHSPPPYTGLSFEIMVQLTIFGLKLAKIIKLQILPVWFYHGFYKHQISGEKRSIAISHVQSSTPLYALIVGFPEASGWPLLEIRCWTKQNFVLSNNLSSNGTHAVQQ